MRHAQVLSISTGVAVTGLLVAACGSTHSTTSTSVPAPPAPAANAAAHASIAFVAPRTGAHVGSTIHVRIRRSEDGRVRFVLDGRTDRVTGATTIIYRHLRPGAHHLAAELLVASGQASAATAVVRFRVRRPPPPPPVVTTVPAPSPPVTTTAPAPPPAPPAQTQTTAAPPAPPTGIPQNGGGDDDSDNHGAPSDGDGNI